MDFLSYPVSPYPAELSRHNLRNMMRLVRTLDRLSRNNAYQALLRPDLPAAARHNPGHYAVMMGYDFHISTDGVKLIEVNTNAGGLWFADLACESARNTFSEPLGQRLLATFLNEYRLFCRNPQACPRLIVILDDKPQQQFLYTEMQIFAALFQQAGIDAVICDPQDLTGSSDGVYWQNRRIDLIYNRHCDFYLATDAMTPLKKAWLNQQLCLTPNPFMYGLFADKRRMIIWSNFEQLQQLNLPPNDINRLVQTIPQTLPLAALPAEQIWQNRKQWVFKPDNGYGSRGVYSGDKLTKNKFAEFDAGTTLMQQRVPPSQTRISADLSYKTDFRLFVYRHQLLAVSARLYQGQVTNLRTENGGFAKVRLV